MVKYDEDEYEIKTFAHKAIFHCKLKKSVVHYMALYISIRRIFVNRIIRRCFISTQTKERLLLQRQCSTQPVC